MRHGLQDGVIEFNGPRNEQSVVWSLGRHDGRGLMMVLRELLVKLRGKSGLIVDVVRNDGEPFGRERGVELGQRMARIQMPGDLVQSLRGLLGRHLFRCAGGPP